MFTRVTRTYNEAFSGCTNLQSISLPEGLTLIGQQAFYKLTNLVRCKLPRTLRTINNNAYSGCTNLSDITLPPSVISIGQGGFSGTKIGGTLYLPNLTTVGPYGMFVGTNIEYITSLGSITTTNNGGSGYGFCYGCKQLKSVILPTTLTTLGSYAFYDCTDLEIVVCEATVPPTFGSNALKNTPCIIYVPDESITAYREASNWSAYADRILPLSEYAE